MGEAERSISGESGVNLDVRGVGQIKDSSDLPSLIGAEDSFDF
jgi:hypothetical protein